MVNRALSAPTSLVAVTSYSPLFFTEQFLTLSDVRSPLADVEVSVLSSGLPFIIHTIVGAGIPDTVNVCETVVPARNDLDASSLRSLSNFGATETHHEIIVDQHSALTTEHITRLLQ